eukprot:scaffold28582_cov160-Skeletonema_menzelii.AAC.1
MLVVIAVVTAVLSLLLMARLILVIGLDASGGLPFLVSSPALRGRQHVRSGKAGHFTLSVAGPFTVPALEVV